MFTVPQQSCGILVTDKGTPSMPYDARSDEGRLRLKRQLGETEGEVVAREGREVEIHAEHVIRPVQGKSVGQGDAELRAGGRQIGARDLDLSRRLDRPAEERLRLPVGARDWPTKPFFRRAIEAPGKVQITRPYLSATGPKFCVTLSYALSLNGSYHVLCVDLDFAALAGDDLAFGLTKLPL